MPGPTEASLEHRASVKLGRSDSYPTNDSVEMIYRPVWSHGAIAVDLDGTLARYERHYGLGEIGEPIIPMLERVQAWLLDGKEVVIFTARLAHRNATDCAVVRQAIWEWTRTHVGRALPATALKSHLFSEIWDDRAVAVERNTGRILGQAPTPYEVDQQLNHPEDDPARQ